METFFSTVAQVSFTLVGLFFVALNLDSATRDYWFGQYPHSRYVYVNFMIMLMPGFLSLGGLVSVGNEQTMPAWPFAGIFLSLIYGAFYFSLRSLRKHPSFAQIAELESKINVASLLFSGTIVLLILSLFGIFSAYFRDASALGQQELLLKILISFLIVSGVLPVIVFTRAFAEINRNPSMNKVDAVQIKIREQLNRPSNENTNNPGFTLWIALVVALFAFLSGWFVRNRN